jgi:hypothetical protein
LGVAAVECGDLSGAETLGDRDKAGVGATQTEVGLLLDERCDALPVAGAERLDEKVAGRDGAVETCFSSGAKLAVNEITSLGDDERALEQTVGCGLDQIGARLMGGIGCRRRRREARRCR